MKRIIIACLLLAGMASQQVVRADEGMWLPLLLKRLNYEDMKKKGCKLTADEIYNINNSSLKDAIVMLSGGSCTAEAISSEGLLLLFLLVLAHPLLLGFSLEILFNLPVD